MNIVADQSWKATDAFRLKVAGVAVRRQGDIHPFASGCASGRHGHLQRMQPHTKPVSFEEVAP
jgi:hypothetical protein